MLRRTIIALAGFLLVHTPVTAQTGTPEGTWLISQRIALEIFPCGTALCGRIAWLRNPSLRTPSMCGRTVIWGLTPDGSEQWTNGNFFDPEDGDTYNVIARLLSANRISARIYKGVSWFGRTEILTRIDPHSLSGWCVTNPA